MLTLLHTQCRDSQSRPMRGCSTIAPTLQMGKLRPREEQVRFRTLWPHVTYKFPGHLRLAPLFLPTWALPSPSPQHSQNVGGAAVDLLRMQHTHTPAAPGFSGLISAALQTAGKGSKAARETGARHLVALPGFGDPGNRKFTPNFSPSGHISRP